MQEDISKKTVAVLLVIAIVISIVGTWVVLNGSPAFLGGEKQGSAGQVFIGIQDGPPQPSAAGGKVEIGIDKEGEV